MHWCVRCLRRNMPGPYQIQAAIAAVHADASTADATDWSQIVQLYDQLLLYMPTPIVALNRAIAVAELDGPAPALAILDQLDLDNYHLYHAARADLLQRLGRFDDASDRLRPIDRPRNQCCRARPPTSPSRRAADPLTRNR